MFGCFFAIHVQITVASRRHCWTKLDGLTNFFGIQVASQNLQDLNSVLINKCDALENTYRNIITF